MEIKASTTPLKRYILTCPVCGDPVNFPCEDPDVPHCDKCEEDVDLDSLEEFISEWLEYLQDRKALYEKENKEAQEEAEKKKAGL